MPDHGPVDVPDPALSDPWVAVASVDWLHSFHGSKGLRASRPTGNNVFSKMALTPYIIVDASSMRQVAYGTIILVYAIHIIGLLKCTDLRHS